MHDERRRRDGDADSCGMMSTVEMRQWVGFCGLTRIPDGGHLRRRGEDHECLPVYDVLLLVRDSLATLSRYRSGRMDSQAIGYFTYPSVEDMHRQV